MKTQLSREGVAIRSPGQWAVRSIPPSAEKSFAFVDALRPFSLVVALVSCGLGIKLAAPEGSVELALATAVMIGGLLLQCGVNLINDHADLHQLPSCSEGYDDLRRQIRRNFKYGLLCFALAAVIGIGVALRNGPEIIAIGLLGLLGAYAYTQEPFNYKRRGLGVVFVFMLMGVLMVQGAYLAITGEFSRSVLSHSLPVSCLISLLLLSNEIRDHDKDAARDIHTLTVRIGFDNAVRLYWALILLAYLATGLLIVVGNLPPSPWLLLSLPVLLLLRTHIRAEDRSPLTPCTGQLLLLFGVSYALAL